MIVNFVSVIFIFMPLYVHFGSIGVLEENRERQYLLDAMNSKEWQFSLVGSIGVSVPIVIDYILDVLQPLIRGTIHTSKAQIPRLLLIISLVVPNLLQLLVSIPLQYVELTCCFFMVRNIILVNGVLGHLWIEGGSVFQLRWFIVGQIFLAQGVTMCCWDAINKTQAMELFWVGVGFGAIGMLIFTKFSLKWLEILRKSNIKKLSISQISCTIYLTVFALFGIALLLLALIFRGAYGMLFSCLYSYSEAAFTVALTVLQNRLTRHEVELKEVN